MLRCLVLTLTKPEALKLGFRTLSKEERDVYSMLFSVASFSLEGAVVKGNNRLMVKKKRVESPSFETLDDYTECTYIEVDGLLTRQIELKESLEDV